MKSKVSLEPKEEDIKDMLDCYNDAGAAKDQVKTELSTKEKLELKATENL